MWRTRTGLFISENVLKLQPFLRTFTDDIQDLKPDLATSTHVLWKSMSCFRAESSDSKCFFPQRLRESFLLRSLKPQEAYRDYSIVVSGIKISRNMFDFKIMVGTNSKSLF